MQIKTLPSLTTKIAEFRALSQNTFPKIPSAASIIDITNPQRLGFYLDKAILEFFNLSLMMSVNNIPLGKRMFMAACVPFIIKGKVIPAISVIKKTGQDFSLSDISKETLLKISDLPEAKELLKKLGKEDLFLFDKNA